MCGTHTATTRCNRTHGARAPSLPRGIPGAPAGPLLSSPLLHPSAARPPGPNRACPDDARAYSSALTPSLLDIRLVDVERGPDDLIHAYLKGGRSSLMQATAGIASNPEESGGRQSRVSKRATLRTILPQCRNFQYAWSSFAQLNVPEKDGDDASDGEDALLEEATQQLHYRLTKAHPWPPRAHTSPPQSTRIRLRTRLRLQRSMRPLSCLLTVCSLSSH